MSVWTLREFGYERHSICDESGAEIAFVHRGRDARLIVTAPELLSALKDVLRSCRKDFSNDPDGESKFREAYAEQFEAIARAEGRS